MTEANQNIPTTVRTELFGDIATIMVHGRLDVSSGDQVTAEVNRVVRTGCRQVEFDLKNVAFMTSAGIRVLVAAAKQLKDLGGTVQIIRASPFVTDVLEAVGIREMLMGQASADAPRGRRVRSAHAEFDAYKVVSGGSYSRCPLGSFERAQGSADYIVPFPQDVLAWGQGLLIAPNGTRADTGRWLAAGGIAAGKPESGPADYIEYAESGIPKLALAEGLVFSGSPSLVATFTAAPNMPFSPVELAQCLPDMAEASPLVFVAIAECSAVACEGHWHDASVALFSGVIAPDDTAVPGLTPLGTDLPWVNGCVAVFVVHPIRLEPRPIAELVSPLFESRLQDVQFFSSAPAWRSTRLLRGVVWAGPLKTE